MKVIKANLEWIDQLSTLFNEYRVFYNQNSDILRAKEFLTDRIKNKESIILLCVKEADNSLIGFTQIYPIFSSVSCQKDFVLNDLYILPKYRKQGGATLLLEASKEEVYNKEGKGLSLETAKDNSARKLYEKLGWEEDDIYKHYYWKA